MKNKFTPGPWLTSYKKRPDGMYSQVVYDKDEENICELAWYPVNEGIVVIDGVERESIRTNREDNAHLIAAAPEMYHLLENIMKCAAIQDNELIDAEEIKDLLDKARGE